MNPMNPADWTAAVNAGLCRLLILREVCHKPGHGYALRRRMAKRTQMVCVPTEATIYPTLAELTRLGCLTETICMIGGRTRKVYAATPAGHQACATGLRAWRTGLRAVCGDAAKA